MRRTGNLRRLVSGFLAGMTLLSTVLSPMTAYASEPKEEEKLPLYEEVKDLLDEDEVVKAKDYEITVGSEFDVTCDFTGLEIKDDKKVKVTFEEAKNEEGKDFALDHADSYKAVYYVEPVNEAHPKYQISRNLIVKEAETEVQAASEGGGEEAGSDGTEEATDDGEADSQEDTEGISEQETEIADEEYWESETETNGETPVENIDTEMPSEADVPETEELISESEETELELETNPDGEYQVDITKGEELGIVLNHEDGVYEPGEMVEFSTNLPEGSLTSVAALKVEANEQTDTADLLYSEVTYNSSSDTFYFEMPEDNIALEVAQDSAEGAVMLLASDDGNDVPWDEATEIDANTYYYYSDGKLHPFDSVMGSGGNDSYKYIRYKVDGKTYTVNAYCMQHSMPSPPSGTTYKNMVELDEGGDDKYLRKALFYGYGGPGWGDTFNGYNIQQIMQKYGCGSETRAMQHYLVDYLYDGESGFGGALSDTAKNMLREIKTALGKMPDPTAQELLPGLSVTASGRDTETFTWKANEAFTITLHLENGVTLVNETTGKSGTGNVTVKGGDKFHLTATTDDISSLKGSYAITSKYPLDFHAMLLKLQNSQDIGFGYYTDSSDLKLTVDWPETAQIDIVKKDSKSNAKIAGAVYGIYSDEAGTNLITKMPATDSNGASSVTIEKTQNTVYLKEISVPNGYRLDTKSYGINLIVGGVTKKEVTDEEQFADLTVYKEGEVLTGASVTDSGVVFQYTKQRLKGAVYNVYAGADIKAADGRVIFQKGVLVKEGLTTGEDGSATLKNLHLGTYVVTEMKAPADYVCKGESKTVTLSYAGQNVEVAVGNVTFANDRQKASVSVVKQDDTTKNPLSGGIYGLYAAEDIADVSGSVVVRKDTLIEKAATGNDGNAVYQADLPINHSYYVKELQAPENYFRNSEDVFSFRFQYTNDKQASVTFTHTFENERVNATIHLVKKDKETGREAQGDAAFEGAVYGVYARENIIHPDGKTGILYKAGSQVATMTVDKKGDASVEDLYLGKYYVKEITPPTGYLIDEGEYDLECSYEGDFVKNVERSTESSEQVMKQPFQVIKAANNGKTDADLLKGAGFTAYLKSSLKTNPDGSYDFASAKPVVLTADGKTEMFTDAKGYACSIPLPYGTYLVKETTTPNNYKPVDDFIVTISENHPDEPQIWRILLDDEFKAKLKIVKKDDETKKPVLVAGTEFKIYDLDHKKYVEQVTTYPITVTHKSYFTDSQGYLILPNNLSIGHYRIEEVTAPDGYTLNQNYVEIAVDSNTAYQMDSVSGDVVIEVDYENHPVKGKLIVYKKGEMLAGFNKDFIYEEQFLKDAVFEVYAVEDIYSPDYQKDADGNRILVYAKDTLVTTITTGEDGMAVAENLPLGAYRVAEKTAPEGFVLNPEDSEVVFVYEGQDTPVVEQEVTVGDERQKVAVTVEKQDAENGAVVAGAVFGIYNKEDITTDGKVIVEADTLLQEMTSDEKGQAGCTLDLPLGSYYVKELKAPAGFVSSNEVLYFDASYQGQDVETVVLEAVKKNQPTTVEITKSDITTGTELDGASLKVLDKDGNVVDEWTSVKDAPHVIKRLVAGETYTLREEFAPYGYLKATDITFTVEDNGDVQKIEMKDEVPTGLLIINKKGEFLDKVTLLDNAKGTVEHLFEYITGSLTEVTFNVYAAEDIKAADGVSEDYFKADELVGTITTDTNGIAQLGDLPVGKYYVKEAETAHGYVLDGEPKFVDLSYRDQDTPVVTYDEAWQNNRQKVKVTVLKKEKDTERVLAGGIFGLFTREDIKNAGGDVLLKADTLIELKTTDENGQITFMADLPVDGNYYVKELYAPDGFVTTNEEQDFTFEYAGADQAEVSYDFTFENEATIVELTKSDLTTGDELPGAHLKVTDEDGNVVDEWVSAEEAHVIKELVVGKTYTMTETKPADGYVTAESIEFTIENTEEIQKHEMKDDVTKVQISKTDITGDQEIPGAKLTILDENDQVVESWTSTEEPHYVEKLPIGRYTLREEQAPKGFILTADVSFEVKDTGEIQTVVMKDDATKGKVILNKTDKETGEPLKGVEFELRDSKGKVLETLKTDAAGHAESILYEIADYKDGKYAGEKKYYLVETKTLDGYTLDKTEHEVVFAYKDDSTPIVEVTFDLTNDKPEVPQTTEGTPGTPSAGNPKTGDETNLWLPVVLLAVSVSGIAGLLAARRKRKRK